MTRYGACTTFSDNILRTKLFKMEIRNSEKINDSGTVGVIRKSVEAHTSHKGLISAGHHQSPRRKTVPPHPFIMETYPLKLDHCIFILNAQCYTN